MHLDCFISNQNVKIATEKRMTLFLALQSTYEHVDIALYSSEKIIDSITISKVKVSSSLITELDTLLTSNNFTLGDIQFIAVNQGPGPFTTLRVVMASVNGIHFAKKIPLAGVSGFQALFEQHENTDYPQTVALLNAFTQDIYCAWHTPDQTILIQECLPFQQALEKINERFPENTIRFLGNALPLYQTEIIQTFGARAYIPQPLVQTCSIQSVARLGFTLWQQNNISHKPLMPIYLKKTTAYSKRS